MESQTRRVSTRETAEGRQNPSEGGETHEGEVADCSSVGRDEVRHELDRSSDFYDCGRTGPTRVSETEPKKNSSSGDAKLTDGDHLTVGDLDSLGRSRTPTRIHNTRHIVRFGSLDHFMLLVFAELDKLVPVPDGDAGLTEFLDRVGGLDVARGAVVDDSFDGRGAGDDGREGSEEVAVGEHAADARFVQRVLELREGGRREHAGSLS